MSTSTSSNKRKSTNSFSVGEGSGRPPPALRKEAAATVSDELNLPAPIWGHVLDYMHYEEVRSALLVDKTIADEAVKYVHTFNIMKVYQMDGPAARRFPNIEEVNCFSLLSVDELTEERSICAKTATRLVPFLVTIPNLKRVFAGGWSEQMTRLIFDRDDFSYDVAEEDTTIFFGCLVRAFLGALKGRLFPHLERISGIAEALDSTEDLCERNKDICSFCRDVCTYFPVKDLLENANLQGFGHCGGADPVKIYELIATKRPNSKSTFEAASERHLCEFTLGTYLREWYIRDEMKGKKLFEKVRAQLQMRVVDSEMSANSFDYMSIPVNYFNKTGLSALDRMIALGFDPRIITKERISSTMGFGASWRYSNGVFAVFAKSTVDALSARGFTLDPKYLIVLNEETEPALKDKMPDVIKEEDD